MHQNLEKVLVLWKKRWNNRNRRKQKKSVQKNHNGKIKKNAWTKYKCKDEKPISQLVHSPDGWCEWQISGGLESESPSRNIFSYLNKKRKLKWVGQAWAGVCAGLPFCLKSAVEALHRRRHNTWYNTVRELLFPRVGQQEWVLLLGS